MNALAGSPRLRRLGEAPLLLALRRVLAVAVFGIAPLAVTAGVIALTIGRPDYFYDFTGGLYGAGTAILHGRNPYQAAFLHHLAAVKRAGGSPSLVYSVPVYPAPANLAVTPLALLPARLAGLVFVLGGIAALAGGLWLLGVRDWRCYGAVLLSWPMVQAVRLGASEPWLVLAVAIVWRTRDALWRPALATAFAVAAKLFLWPLGVFLVIMRRPRVAALAVAIAVLGTLGAWALSGFAGLAGYPRMLSDVSYLESGGGCSLVAAGLALGLSRALAQALAYAAGAALLAGAWRLRKRPERAFGLSVMAALAASPIVWSHYLVLVFVPIALLSPRLTPLWLVPLLAWLAPVELSHADFWLIAPYLGIELFVNSALLLEGAESPAGRLGDRPRSTKFSLTYAANRPTTGSETVP